MILTATSQGVAGTGPGLQSTSSAAGRVAIGAGMRFVVARRCDPRSESSLHPRRGATVRGELRRPTSPGSVDDLSTSCRSGRCHRRLDSQSAHRSPATSASTTRLHPSDCLREIRTRDFPPEADYRFRATDSAYHTEVGAFVTDVSPDIPFPPGLGPPLPGGYNIGLNDWELSQFRPDEVIVGAQVSELPAPGGPIVGPVYVYLGLTGGALDEPLHSRFAVVRAWSLSAFSDPNASGRFGASSSGRRRGSLEVLRARLRRSGAVSWRARRARASVLAVVRRSGYRRARS